MSGKEDVQKIEEGGRQGVRVLLCFVVCLLCNLQHAGLASRGIVSRGILKVIRLAGVRP